MPKLPRIILTNLGTVAKFRGKYSACLCLPEKGIDFCVTKTKSNGVGYIACCLLVLCYFSCVMLPLLVTHNSSEILARFGNFWWG